MGYAISTKGCRCVVPCVIVTGIICFTMDIRPRYLGIKTLRMRYNLQSNKKNQREIKAEMRVLSLRIQHYNTIIKQQH